MAWTKEQLEAMTAPIGESNILVSAAAGSGKTAVLVNRIVGKVMNLIEGKEVDKTSLDRILVVTFTRAAASEMKTRIISELTARMKGADKETGGKIREQIRLAESSDITTMDSFCYKTVQNSFDVLGIDPDISIANDVALDSYRREAFDNMFKSLYIKLHGREVTGEEMSDEDRLDAERFRRLIDLYTGNRGDRDLEELIERIYKLAMNTEDPDKWLDEQTDEYSAASFMRTKTAKRLYGASLAAIEEYNEAVSGTDTDNDDNDEQQEFEAAYKKLNIDGLSCKVEEINPSDWDMLFNFYNETKDYLSGLKLEDEYSTDLFKAKKQLLGMLEDGITQSFEAVEKSCNMSKLKEQAEDLIWIVKLFMREYAAVKKKNGVMEHGDVAHLVYKLFSLPEYENIRTEYKNKFDEILIDEYQDTNSLQHAIFSRISSGTNMFMVGDLKQSIYRFRSGDPKVFIDRRREDSCRKIILNQNFRSRKEVMDSINDLFSCIMSEYAGDVEYNQSEFITREDDYYGGAKPECKSELVFVPKRDKEAEESPEISFVADEIRNLLDTAKVYDKDCDAPDHMRKVKMSDIAILESSVKSNGYSIVKALRKRGIAAVTSDDGSFFDHREVVVMLSLLSVIVNARQDVPLIAVMRSPIGGFTEDELVRIRTCCSSRNFISAVRAAAKQECDMQLSAKCSDFCEKLSRWRSYTRTKSVAELIWTLYEETVFYDLMGAIEKGEDAQGNLKALYERACQFEAGGNKGLFRFVEYMHALEESNDDLANLKLTGGTSDSVMISTIHKSKGLEYPYVFLIRTAATFHMDREKVVSLNKEYGIGLRYIDPVSRKRVDTPFRASIERMNIHEGKSERMRLLYVALTRAREKLYVVSEPAAGAKKMTKTTVFNKKMLPTAAIAASGFHYWLVPAIESLADEDGTWRVRNYEPPAENVEFSGGTIEDTEDSRASVLDTDEETLKKEVSTRLEYVYSHSGCTEIPSRVSVTRLKEMNLRREAEMENVQTTLPETEAEPQETAESKNDNGGGEDDFFFSGVKKKPAFIEDAEMQRNNEGSNGEKRPPRKPANEIGDLYHLVMSRLDLKAIGAAIDGSGMECINDALCGLVSDKVISESDLRYIDPVQIYNFFISPLGRRAACADELHREAPFQINIPVREYDPALTEAQYDDENLILQGIIDCFFKDKETGKYVLYDYKTDTVRKGHESEAYEKYSKQLDLYARAIEQLTGNRIDEKYLYLFKRSAVVSENEVITTE